jgi:hypothetical protein
VSVPPEPLLRIAIVYRITFSVAFAQGGVPQRQGLQK